MAIPEQEIERVKSEISLAVYYGEDERCFRLGG